MGKTIVDESHFQSKAFWRKSLVLKIGQKFLFYRSSEQEKYIKKDK